MKILLFLLTFCIPLANYANCNQCVTFNHLPVLPADEVTDQYWKEYDEIFKVYLDDWALVDGSYNPKSYAEMLFDKSEMLYVAYERFGDPKILDVANKLTDEYAVVFDESIDPELPWIDIKRLYANGFKLYNKYNDTDKYVSRIIEAYKQQLSWNPDYTLDRNFFTERHQAAVQGVANVMFELGLDNEGRAKEVFEATYKHQKNPINGWTKTGGIVHTLRSHEGDELDVPISSIWMSALLSEENYRYYLLSGDKRALESVFMFGELIADYGVIEVTNNHPEINGWYIPWYFAYEGWGSSVNSTVHNQVLGPWGDREHCPDVMTALVRARAAGIQLGFDTSRFDIQIERLQECSIKLLNALKARGVRPPRKLAWWYGSGMDASFQDRQYTLMK